MDSRHEENLLREVPDIETLHELLSRLNETDTFEPVTRSQKITVEDIAEALNLDSDYVAEELEAILEEHRDARLAGVIRELEEPLYRVERTGHSVQEQMDNPIFKLRSVKILTEKNREKVVVPRRILGESHSERIGNLIGKFMLFLMIAIMVLLGVKAVIAIALQR
jgi:hypothetical protein